MERPIRILLGVAYLEVSERPRRRLSPAELRAEQLEHAADLRRWLADHPTSQRPKF